MPSVAPCKPTLFCIFMLGIACFFQYVFDHIFLLLRRFFLGIGPPKSPIRFFLSPHQHPHAPEVSIKSTAILPSTRIRNLNLKHLKNDRKYNRKPLLLHKTAIYLPCHSAVLADFASASLAVNQNYRQTLQGHSNSFKHDTQNLQHRKVRLAKSCRT